MKIDGYNNSFSGSHLFCFTSSVDGWGLNLFLLHKDHNTSPTGQNVFYLAFHNNIGAQHRLISNNTTITTSSIADGQWHHYAVSLHNEGNITICNFYFDGQINRTTPVTQGLVNFTSSMTTFIMSGSTLTGSAFTGGSPPTGYAIGGG